MASYATKAELRGGLGLLRNLSNITGIFTAPAWMSAVFNQGQSSSVLSKNIGRVPGITPNPQTDLGRRAGNELSYIGSQLSQGRIPYTGSSATPSGGLRNFGPGYKEAELRAGAAAERFRPGAGFPGQQDTSTGSGGPAERAYRQEVSRTAQLAAQNPELASYAKNAADAKTSGDQARMDAVRDQGMAIWAAKYGKPGQLASLVKPGQSGYDVIQRTLNAGAMGSPMNFPFDSSNLLASAPAAPAPSYQGATPSPLTGVGSLPTNALAGATATPYSNMLQGQTLQSAPLAVPSVQPTASYEGAQNLQGIGAPLTSDQFATDKARQLKDMYLKAALGTR